MSSQTYLVTGGAGFIGSTFIRNVLADQPDLRILNLDAMSYGSSEVTIAEFERLDNYRFVMGSILDVALVDELVSECDVIVNFAAESHVDRSIDAPVAFAETNVVGTAVLLEAANRRGIERYLQVSTDEVYGSLAAGAAIEEHRLDPSSPYSASKAAADLLVGAYHRTYGFPGVITRSTNNYGPYQFPEKLIPRFITNLLDGLTVPVFGDGLNVRDWLYVGDHCAAIALVLKDGEPGLTYNVGAGAPVSNLDLTFRLLDLLGKDGDAIEFVEDRPGHDRRYAVDTSRLHSLGWSPMKSFTEGIAQTVTWYLENEDWWRPLKEGIS